MSATNARLSWKGVLIAALLVTSAGLGVIMQPKLEVEQFSQERLEDMVPKSFGGWTEIPNPTIPVDVAVDANNPSNEQPYDDLVMRSYRNDRGETMMVAVAYGRNQRQEMKVHRPEVCYSANGGNVSNLMPIAFPFMSQSGVQVVGMRMRADSNVRRPELVSYWIRVGHVYSQSGLKQRWHILTEGLAGRRADGVLVRVSQILAPGQNPEELYKRQEQFAADFVRASKPDAQTMMIR